MSDETEKLQEKINELEKKVTNQQNDLLQKDLPSPRKSSISNENTLLGKFKFGLSKTKKILVDGFVHSLFGDRELDEELFDEIEEQLLLADLGVPTTRKIIEILEEQYEKKEIHTEKEAKQSIQSIIQQIMKQNAIPIELVDNGPTIFLFIGVNGVGKTTTIGKLAAKYKSEGKKVLIAAGDTFRAAAIDQLQVWAKRTGVDFFGKKIGSDPSATLYEASQKAVEENYDILLCDTSGRLHTKKHLMNELEKMRRVIQKNVPSGPHFSFLVLDATTGQNAIRQTKEFKEIVPLNGLIVTKLDGTSKGGVVIGIVNEFEIPVVYIGVGEKMDDLQPFSANIFATSLFSD